MRVTGGALVALLGAAAFAQPPGPNLASEVDVVENLGQRVPLGLTFTDSTGARVQLSDLFHEERPVILTLVYHRCPTLCGLVLNGLVGSMRQAGLKVGRDYSVVTVSIDPTEPPALAAEKKREVLGGLGIPDDAPGWTFLTGEEPSIRALAEAVGFRYAYDAELRQYAHAAVLMVLTAEGVVSRYVYGVRYPARELRLALVEAAGGRVGTAFDRFLLTCYRYDPASRRYELFLRSYFRLGGLLVFLALAAMLVVLWRRELQRAHGRDPAEGG